MTSSRELQIGVGTQNSLAFAQQGQIDWINFGKTVFKATLSVWQRLSGNNVQEITYGCTLALGTRFKLGRHGNERIEKAIETASGAFGHSNVLYYGFGIQSLIRTLSDHQEGANMVALVSCLACTHKEALVARILASMWNVEEFPEIYRPSHQQWLQLTKSCSGLVIPTTYPETVSVILASIGALRSASLRDTSSEVTNAEDTARILQAIFRISQGRYDRIRVVGGVEGPILAALALWLFDFRIHVTDTNDNLLFTNVSSEADAQITVQYIKQGNRSALQRTVITETTYVMRPYSSFDLVNAVGEAFPVALIFRIPWNGCLKQTFGSTFDDLIALERHVAIFIGAVARIRHALACHELEVDKFSRHSYCDYSSRSYGLGLVASMFDTFPELANSTELKEMAGSQTAIDVEKACLNIESAVAILKQTCVCTPCTGSKARGFSSRGERCLVALMLTIVKIATITALVVQTDQDCILPAAQGLENLYQQTARRWGEVLTKKAKVLDLICDRTKEPIRQIMSARLASVVTIFTGEAVTAEDPIFTNTVTACTRRGVCFYMDSHREPSTDPELLCLFHVRAGHISHGSQRYDFVFDPDVRAVAIPDEAEETTFHKLQDNLSHISQSGPMDIPSNHQFTVVPILTERHQDAAITLYYKYLLRSHGRDLAFRVAPGALTRSVLYSSGIVPCEAHSGDTCQPFDLQQTQNLFPIYVVETGWNVSDDLHDEISSNAGVIGLWWRWHAKSSASRCIIASQGENGPSSIFGARGQLLMRGNSCWSCISRFVSTFGSRMSKTSDPHTEVVHIL